MSDRSARRFRRILRREFRAARKKAEQPVLWSARPWWRLP